jgi:3-hydroxy-9,10-secoandrosta-1,3,5(10)-triene-9,17-dione monooxygenase reductase component
MQNASLAEVVDPRRFRDVLGCYPTGVCVITSRDADDACHGMVVGTFASISLDPPLVGFFPGRQSSSWARICATGRFCVNVLSSEQASCSTRFASRGGHKFAGLSHGWSPTGMPLLDGIVAWIECSIESVTEVGDHFFVVGAVEDLGSVGGGEPLLFFRGRYRELSAPAS